MKTKNRTTISPYIIDEIIGTTIDIGLFMAAEERRISKKIKDDVKAQTRSGWNKPNKKHRNTGRRNRIGEIDP